MSRLRRLFLLWLLLPVVLQAQPDRATSPVRLVVQPLAAAAGAAMPFVSPGLTAAAERNGVAMLGRELWITAMAEGRGRIRRAGDEGGGAEFDRGAGSVALVARGTGLIFARVERSGEVTLWSLPVESGRAATEKMQRLGAVQPSFVCQHLGLAVSAGLAGEMAVVLASDEARTEAIAVDLARGTIAGRTVLAGEAFAAMAIGRGHVVVMARVAGNATTATMLPLATFRAYPIELPEELRDGIRAALPLAPERTAASVALRSARGEDWLLRIDANARAGGMSRWDVVVLVGYLVIVVAIGFACAKRISSGRELFLGGGRVPGWAAGLSIVLTNISAISFIALPSRAFATDSTMLLFLFTPVVAAPIVLKWIAPMFRRGAYLTAYEVLGVRFGPGFRQLGSWLFCAYEIGRIGVLLVVPAILISMITGIPELWCILATASFTILYTTIGGYEAVVWTDVFQGGVLLLALLATPILIFLAVGSVPETFHTAFAAGKLRLVGSSASLGREGWLVLILSLATSANSYLWHQPTVQRLLSARDDRAVRSTVISAAISSPLLLTLMFFGGAMLYSFYVVFPERMAVIADSRDEVFASFIVRELPSGVGGLVVAAIFATSMSSLSGAINSLTAVLASDLMPAARRDALVGSRRFSRWATAICGAVGALVAVLVAKSGAQSLFDLFIEFTNLLSGSLAGVFVLALFGNRFRTSDAMVGFVVSVAAVVVAKASGTMSFMLYGTIGTAACLVGAAVTRLVYREPLAPAEPAAVPQSSR